MENGLLGDKCRNRLEPIAVNQVRNDGGLDQSLQDVEKCLDLGYILKRHANVGEERWQEKSNPS